MNRAVVHTGRPSRRTLLKTAAGGALLSAAGGLTATLAGTASAAPATSTHPGMLHNAGDINRAKVQVAKGGEPWTSGWKKLLANAHSQASWKPNPQATVVRGGT